MIALVLTLWAATRWKPVGWFPAGYGAVLGLIGAWLAGWMQAGQRRGQTIGLTCLPAVGVALSLILAAEHQVRRDQPQLTGLAAEMVKTHERLTGESGLDVGRSVWQARIDGLGGYLESRYGRHPAPILAAVFCVESVVAACAGWGASCFVRGAAPGLKREADA